MQEGIILLELQLMYKSMMDHLGLKLIIPKQQDMLKEEQVLQQQE